MLGRQPNWLIDLGVKVVVRANAHFVPRGTHMARKVFCELPGYILGGPVQAAGQQGAQLGPEEEGGGEAQHTRRQDAGQHQNLHI